MLPVPDVMIQIRRIHLKIWRYQKISFSFLEEILEKLIVATESANRGARNLALLLSGYDTKCRITDLVTLLTDDVRYSETTKITKINLLI
jgi:hypothetical protein